MRTLKKISNIMNPPKILYSKPLYCGCKVKHDGEIKEIVELCKGHWRQHHILMTYEAPEGYVISDDV